MTTDFDSSVATASTSVAPPAPKTHRFEFRATAGEYFKIWIVNVLLTIVTFGIYSAWAKVRTRRYLYGNTSLAGATFDYHADPIKILYGRLIVGALGLLYTLSPYVSPFLTGAVVLTFLALFPFFLVRGSIFNHTNTSYRSIRFGFKRDYKGAYGAYFKGLGLTAITLGLAYPYAYRMLADFRVSRSRFGNTPFRFTGAIGGFFTAIYGGVGIYFLMAVIAMAVTIGGGLAIGMSKESIVFPMIGGVYLGMAVAYAFFRAKISNAVLGGIEIAGAKFRCEMSFFELLWLYVTGAIAVVCTLGLAFPWAFIRVLRYKAQSVTLTVTDEELDRFQRPALSSEGAISDAAADFWDLDIGF